MKKLKDWREELNKVLEDWIDDGCGRSGYLL